jgi:hypothetical protein
MKLARDDTYGTKKNLLVRRNEVAPLSPNMGVRKLVGTHDAQESYQETYGSFERNPTK